MLAPGEEIITNYGKGSKNSYSGLTLVLDPLEAFSETRSPKGELLQPHSGFSNINVL